MYLVTSEQMQVFDNRTIAGLKVPGIVLMEHAGREVAQDVASREARRVVVLCGKGNNGGDGWIAARWLNYWGSCCVHVLSLVEPSQLHGDAALAAQMAIAAGVSYQVYHEGDALEAADVYVDALLGTGITRPLRGELETLVRQVNELSRFTIAVDVPTGIDASTGEVGGTAILAQQTICMAYQKLGTAISPGCYQSGEVKVVDIGIRAEDASDCATQVTPEQIVKWMPTRGPKSHKGTFGRVGVVVGQMKGAALLAGLGAARSGAGLVMLGVPAECAVNAPYEFVLRPLNEANLNDTFAGSNALVVGPGLGQLDVVRSRNLAQAIRSYKGKGVIDADALRLLTLDDMSPLPPGQFVLTPHPKECGKLLGWSTDEVQAHRLEAAARLAKQTNSTVVLKGYHSVIVNERGGIRVNPTGNAALSKAGTGDVLAGIIGGLLAQHLSPFDAAATGAWVHGMAGELAGQARSKSSTIASDVVENISCAMSLVST